MPVLEAHIAAPPGRSAAAAGCAHCGLPVPRGLIDLEAAEQFCCAACRTVFEAIHACGLEGYYAVRARIAAPEAPARSTGAGYQSFDDPAFAAAHVRPAPGGLAWAELYLENVHCAACVWLIERLPHVLAGLREARLDLRRRAVRLRYDPSALALSAIARRLDRLGYSPHALRGAGDLERRRAEDRAALVRIGAAGAAAGNAMLIAFALYGGMLHGMEPGYAALFRWSSLLVAAASLAWPGRIFFVRALAALRAGTVNMDVPIATGLAGGAIWSAVNTVRGHGEVYFESLTVLVFLLLVGRHLQLCAQRRSQDALDVLFSLTPGTARLVEGEALREVPVSALAAGAVVEVAAGASIPADGTVVKGRSRLDRSMLSGESWPIPVGEGETVHAGTVNLESPLRIAVLATGEATRLGRLMRLVEEGAARRAPIVVLADRMAAWFAGAVLAMAALTCALWLAIDPARAVPNAVALLVVTCPCALAMATPLAIVAALGRAARSGILIKGGDVVERLRRPGLVLLDKTGTLTAGCARVVAWHGTPALRAAAAAVERHSNHPVARAIAAEYGALPGPDATGIRAEADGIAASVGPRRIVAGTRGFLERNGIALPEWAIAAAGKLASRAVTPVFIAGDGILGAVAGVGDPIKPGAADAIAELRRLGWSVGVLSGDDERTVQAAARALAIDARDCLGGVGPERKQAIVLERMRHGPVVMVGDGVNDAAALAAATVGVAVRGGAEASLSAADVYVSAPGLSGLVDLLRGSRRTLVVIRRNLAVSLVYNALGATLAIAGLMNPLVAAVLMPISSLSVLTLSLRSATFEAPPCR